MNKYRKIKDEEFDDAVRTLAAENIQETLSLPGIWEIISEHYNNEALDLALSANRGKRVSHLMTFIEKQKVFHTPLYMR